MLIQPISLKKQCTMKGVKAHRLRTTTHAEKKMCFTFQAMCWHVGGIVRYRREKTIHRVDILSRSADFYFKEGKLGIEVETPCRRIRGSEYCAPAVRPVAHRGPRGRQSITIARRSPNHPHGSAGVPSCSQSACVTTRLRHKSRRRRGTRQL